MNQRRHYTAGIPKRIAVPETCTGPNRFLFVIFLLPFWEGIKEEGGIGSLVLVFLVAVLICWHMEMGALRSRRRANQLAALDKVFSDIQEDGLAYTGKDTNGDEVRFYVLERTGSGITPYAHTIWITPAPSKK